MGYLVVQVANYVHGVAGPFDTLEEAIAFADNAAREDVDSHHAYEVYEGGAKWVRPRSFWLTTPACARDEGEDFLHSTDKQKAEQATENTEANPTEEP